MTTTSILLAQSEKRIIQRTLDEEIFGHIVDYLLSASQWCLLLAVSSLGSLFVDIKPFLWWHGYAFALWLAIATGTGLAVYRTVRILTKILRSVAADQHNTD
jgi:hypothetical protein